MAAKSTVIDHICECCGTKFSAPAKQNRKFCSSACFYKVITKPRERSCAHCGKTFIPARSSKKPQYCSYTCAGKGRATRSNDNPYIHHPKNAPSILYDSDHPNGIRLHRYLMQKHLGRKLERNELVAHIDGDIRNNDISNLKIVYCVRSTRFRKKEATPTATSAVSGYNTALNKLFIKR